MSTIPKTLELCAGGTQFYLRDEFGGYIAQTCGSEDWAEAQATEICLRYNQHERLKRELNAANAELEHLKAKPPQRWGPYGKLEDHDPYDPV